MCAGLQKGEILGLKGAKLFVGSLTKNTNRSELIEYFSRYGNINSFEIVEKK